MIIQPADRLEELQEYYFSKKLKEVNRLKSEGKEIINMGIGNPDLMPDSIVVSELIEGVIESKNHGYQPYQGISELKDAIIDFSSRRFNISLELSEVLPLIGSKEGITHISLAYLNPGDKVLIPELGYPTYTSVTKMVGAKPVYYPFDDQGSCTPDWKFLEEYDYTDTKIIWLNYPNMPTGQKGSQEILSKFVALAKSKGVLLCHDNPYSFILNDNPLSVFNIEAAKSVALELNSLSKTFNMAGWRVGWLAGSKELLEPVLRVKSNMDSGMFKPIQLAAAKALNLKDAWFEDLNELYSKRRKLVWTLLDKVDCKYSKDQVGMFVWAKVPTLNAEDFCNRLLYKKDIFMTPGHIFGEKGSAYVRVSLCVNEALIQKAIDRI